MSAGRLPWWIGVAAVAGAWLVRVLGRTWRIEERNDPAYDAAMRDGERVIYCFWHARMLPLVYTHRGRRIAVLVSRHRDGELIARVIGALGYVLARGSSTRAGEAGLREILTWGERGHSLGFTPDGPRGPAQRAKDGVIYASARLGLRIVPLASSSRGSWVARSWDGFRVPWPFARVVVAHGAPLSPPPDVQPASIAEFRLHLESVLDSITRDVATRAGEHA